MDTWNVLRLILDAAFAGAIVAVITVFLYRREKSLRATIAKYVLDASGQAQVSLKSEPASTGSDDMRLVPNLPRSIRPRMVAEYETQKSFAPTAPVSRKASRTERYLEAVRMYRQGSQREEIERSLGISFMELELLGQLK